MRCQFCREEISFSFGDERNKELKDGKKCFSCDFWLKRINEYDSKEEKVLVIDGVCYSVGPENNARQSSMRGFGGRLFEWVWTDEERKDAFQTSTNLWHRGDIPNHFKSALAENAYWIGG